MKKSLLIGTIVVILVLAIAGAAIAYASWDKTKDSLELTANSVASNVNVTAAAVANSADTTNNLIPSVAKIRTSKDTEKLKAGQFTVKLSSDNASATYAELYAKVNATYKITAVTLDDGTAIKSGTNDWTKYVKVSVSKGSVENWANSGTLALDANASNATTTFDVLISFQNFSAVSTDAEKTYIKSLSGKKFKIAIEVEIASKPQQSA